MIKIEEITQKVEEKVTRWREEKNIRGDQARISNTSLIGVPEREQRKWKGKLSRELIYSKINFLSTEEDFYIEQVHSAHDGWQSKHTKALHRELSLL